MPSARDEAQALALPDRVEWAELEPEFLAAWGFPDGKFQPQHLSIVGPTGSGKSWFEKTILAGRAEARRSHIVIIATKPADATLLALGWPVVTEWPPPTKRKWPVRRGSSEREPRQFIFWAKAGGLSTEGRERQKAAITDLLDKLWRPNSNTVVAFDELAYIQDELKLKTTVETYFREARALGITIVASTQRPQGITRYFHSEATWSVFFAPKDEEDAERMAETAGNRLYYRRVFAELDRAKHEFLMVNSRTGEAVISSIPGKRRSRPAHLPSDDLEKRAPHV